jgi:putative sterol carrier protein
VWLAGCYLRIVPIFPSEEWVREWVELANASPEFEKSGAGWEGAVGVVIEADRACGLPETVFLRLDGREGKWLNYELGTNPASIDGAVLTLRAPYRRWKQLVAQEIDPVKAVLQGRLRVRGSAKVILRRIDSLSIVMRLAGTMETTFVDDGL